MQEIIRTQTTKIASLARFRQVHDASELTARRFGGSCRSACFA